MCSTLIPTRNRDQLQTARKLAIALQESVSAPWWRRKYRRRVEGDLDAALEGYLKYRSKKLKFPHFPQPMLDLADRVIEEAREGQQ